VIFFKTHFNNSINTVTGKVNAINNIILLIKTVGCKQAKIMIALKLTAKAGGLLLVQIAINVPFN